MPKVHRVEQGDCISSIAAAYGLRPSTIWNDPANSQLRSSRKDPELLYPGDEITIPELSAKQEGVGTDQRHRFRRKDVPAYLRLRLLDRDHQPRANLEYSLDIEGELRKGITDGNGMIIEPIPPYAMRASLLIETERRREEHEICLGHVDPLSTIEGIQQRLKNLGLDCGAVDGELGERTAAAIKQFQRLRGLEPSGELDDPTRSALESVHGN